MPSWPVHPSAERLLVYCKVLEFKLGEKQKQSCVREKQLYVVSVNEHMNENLQGVHKYNVLKFDKTGCKFSINIDKKNLQPGLSYLLFKHIIIVNSLRVCCFYLVGDSMIYLMQLSAVQFCSKSHTESLILELTFSEIVVKSKYFFLGDYLQSITRTP